jgi:hypothetical protein
MDLPLTHSRPGGARRIDSRWTKPRTPALWGFNDPRPFSHATLPGASRGLQAFSARFADPVRPPAPWRTPSARSFACPRHGAGAARPRQRQERAASSQGCQPPAPATNCPALARWATTWVRPGPARGRSAECPRTGGSSGAGPARSARRRRSAPRRPPTPPAANAGTAPSGPRAGHWPTGRSGES